jgi:hypothetical protein
MGASPQAPGIYRIVAKGKWDASGMSTSLVPSRVDRSPIYNVSPLGFSASGGNPTVAR